MRAEGPRLAPSKGEQAQWSRQYLAAAGELSQWEVVAEYASFTENYGLMAECLWRLHDWARLKEIVLPKAMVRAGRLCPLPPLHALFGLIHCCFSECQRPCREWLLRCRFKPLFMTRTGACCTPDHACSAGFLMRAASGR